MENVCYKQFAIDVRALAVKYFGLSSIKESKQVDVEGSIFYACPQCDTTEVLFHDIVVFRCGHIVRLVDTTEAEKEVQDEVLADVRDVT